MGILVQSVRPGRHGPHIQGPSRGVEEGFSGRGLGWADPLDGSLVPGEELGLARASGMAGGWMRVPLALERMFHSAWSSYFLACEISLV